MYVDPYVGLYTVAFRLLSTPVHNVRAIKTWFVKVYVEEL